MRGSFLIARIAGTGVYIHFTFPLLVAFYGWLYYHGSSNAPEAYEHGGMDAAIFGVTLILLLFFCVLLHEFGHAFAARAFGIRTPDITLLPIGGVARLERMPSSPWQELVIAVAGPAVNVVIAIGLGVFLFGVSLPQDLLKISAFSEGLSVSLLSINIGLVIFNMIPAFPMDGGRVLRALLAMFINHSKATAFAARIGQGIAILFVVASFTPYGSTMLLFIAVFIFMAAQQELTYARRPDAALAERVGDVMVTGFATVSENLSAGEIRALLFQSQQEIFPVVDDNQHMLGLMFRADITEAVRDVPAGSPISGRTHAIPAVDYDCPLDEAARLLQTAPIPILAVKNAAGQLAGLVSQHQLVTQAKP